MQAIFNAANRMRYSLRDHDFEPNGPFLLGDLTTVQANTCVDRADPEAALMYLPSANRRGYASLWLTGDASTAHNTIARSFSHALHKKQLELGDRRPRATVDVTSAPQLVNVRFPGTLNERSYKAGVGKKRPAAMFYDATLALYPIGCENTLALEVAYKNDTIQSVLLSALLWTQQGLNSALPMWQPVNFLGVKVCQDSNNEDPTRPAWAVVRATKANEAGRGTTEIFLFNASAEWEEAWRTQLKDTKLTDTKLITDKYSVELKLSFFHPALPDVYNGEKQVIKVDEEMLNQVFYKAVGVEASLLASSEKCREWLKRLV